MGGGVAREAGRAVSTKLSHMENDLLLMEITSRESDQVQLFYLFSYFSHFDLSNWSSNQTPLISGTKIWHERVRDREWQIILTRSQKQVGISKYLRLDGTSNGYWILHPHPLLKSNISILHCWECPVHGLTAASLPGSCPWEWGTALPTYRRAHSQWLADAKYQHLVSICNNSEEPSWFQNCL